MFDPGPEIAARQALGPPKPPKPDFEVTVEIRQDLKFDLPRFLENRLDEYLDWKPEAEYSGDGAADRLLGFLSYWLEQESGDLFFWSGDRTVEEKWFGDFDVDFDRGMTTEKAEVIHESLGLTPDGKNKAVEVVRFPNWY